MAHSGQTLENPASGERITFRRTAANTGGELLAIDLELPVNRRVPGGPALRMEQLFETAVGLAEQGRTMSGGIPKPLDLALFTEEFEDEVQGAFPPRWLQRIVLAPLAWLARRRRHLRPAPLDVRA